MSRKNSNKRYTKAQIQARIEAKKKAKRLAMQKHITIFTLLALLVIGLVSTTFASFVSPAQTGESGSLIADIKTLAVNQGNKDHITSVGANADISSTGADTYYLAGTMNGWNTTSTPMTQGTDVNGQTFYYSGYYSNQEQFKVVKNGGTWLGYEKQSSSIYSNSLTIYNYGDSGNCWPGSGGYYVVYNPTKDKISCVTVLPLQVVSTPFEVGDIVYFDIRNNTGWLTADASSQMYIQFNNSTTGSTSNRAQMTRVGEYLYAYKFTSQCDNSIRFWRGNSSSMWNYSKSLSAANGNGVYIATNGWSGSGTEATFTMTSITAPTLTANPTEFVKGSSTTLSSTNSFTITYKRGSTSYTTTAQADDLKYTFKNGSSALGSASSSNTKVWTPSTAGTYTTYVTVTGTLSGLSATSNGVSITVKDIYTYTVTANTGGTVLPLSGSVTAGESASIKATPSTGFTFAEWTNETKGSVKSTTSATTDFTPTATGASVKANFRPNAPSALTLTGSNVASGTSGTGTEANPYIVFNDGGFTLTANTTVPNGATTLYNTTPSLPSSNNTGNTFNPSLGAEGTPQSYIVYAWSYAGGYYSTSSFNATAHYMVFSHLSGANTGFTVSSDSITDAETLTLSGAYVNGIEAAENEYITQTYQVSTNNSTFSDLSDTTWSPTSVGTYYFRLKTTNIKTGETVYSSSQLVTVVQSTVYYDITVVRASGSGTAGATFKTNGTTITDNKILSNNPLTISLVRSNAIPSNYYFTYIKVTDGTNTWNINNLNGDLIDQLVIDHIKGNVTIEYHTTIKPLVQPDIPENAESINFKYLSDGVEKTANVGGDYYVDYNSDISYSVTPKTGYYVSDMIGVKIGTITSSTVTGTNEEKITSNLGVVTAKVIANKTITVKVDTASAVTTGGSMTIDGAAHALGTPKGLNYGAEATVVITPPSGCYAVVSGNNVQSTISTDGKATFKVKLEGYDLTYTVKFVANPKIYMVQPRYGSVYVTDDLGNYYFNGDSVGYGTKLTVHVKPDHANAKLSNVLVNNASIGTADGSTFYIKTDSTASATITVSDDFAFAENAGTEYGTRRIFFTDTCAWGNSNASNVLVHYSNTLNDTNFTSNNITMTRKYYNEYSQYVYYADIPFSAKYVTFVNAANKAQCSAQGTIVSTNNAYYMGNTGNYPRAISSWVLNYSDYNATDRADTIMQATTSKGNAATFQYTCDFGDETLSAEVVSGNAATFDFDKGTFSITPTQNIYNYSLVKVTSAASTTVKYYLIKVDNFEIDSFSGLQKIYKANVLNKIQLDLILKGGVLNYAAKLFVSDTNATGSYTEQTADQSGFTQLDSLEGYINSFLIEYSVSGVKYFKVEATDGANHTATSTAKTLFGINTYKGERTLYFYNNTNLNLSKYKLRACFMDENSGNKTFVTMQQVANTDYYRAVIPKDADSKVNFYLCNPKTFSDDYADFDGVDDSNEFYSFRLLGASVPDVNAASIVFKATSIDTTDGIKGAFVDFDY